MTDLELPGSVIMYGWSWYWLPQDLMVWISLFFQENRSKVAAALVYCPSVPVHHELPMVWGRSSGLRRSFVIMFSGTVKSLPGGLGIGHRMTIRACFECPSYGLVPPLTESLPAMVPPT